MIAKFVVADPSEVDEIRAIVERFGFQEVYLMPLTATSAELATGLSQLVSPPSLASESPLAFRCSAGPSSVATESDPIAREGSTKIR